MIAVVDYGVGNLYSLTCSLRHIGAQCTVTREENTLRTADRIILPGVGAFGDAAEKLHALRLDALLCDLAGQGKPLMGICLGMQLLFDKSHEYGEHAGLGLIPGEVRPLAPFSPPAQRCRTWAGTACTSTARRTRCSPGVREGDFVYYVHSFYATGCGEALAASSDYGGVTVAGAVRRGSVCGTQFHPEKSGAVGLRILRAFAMGEEDAAC